MEREIKKIEPYMEKINNLHIEESLVGASQPLNEIEEFAKFSVIKNYIPSFIYASQNRQEIINKIKIMDKIKDKFSKEDVNIDIKIIAEKIIRDKINILYGLLNIGTPYFTEISSRVYGVPTYTTYKIALDIVRHIGNIEEEKKNINSLDARNIFKSLLSSLNLNKWDVKILPNIVAIYVNPKKRQIAIPLHKKFNYKELIRLTIHEIGTHVFRAENALSQPYNLFRNSFPQYLQTEEGLALYNEFRTGYMNLTNLREYALRYIAVYKMYSGCTFVETYKTLKELGAPDREAWRITVRAYRGGGLVKDHVYLEGFLTVKKFMETKRKENIIMCCRMNIEYEKIVKELYNHNILLPPQYTLYQLIDILKPYIEHQKEKEKTLTSLAL